MTLTASTTGAEPVALPAATLAQQRRAGMLKITLDGVAKLPPLPDTLEELQIYIPVQDGWLSRTKVVRPKAGRVIRRPLIVHFFGGGMMVGDPEQLLSPAREFAEAYGAVVVLPSYRLVPDVTWPTPYKDGWDTLVWLSKHAEAELGADLDAGFIVGGVSAGAAVSAVCGGLAMFPESKEAQEAPKLSKPLTGQFLCVPMLVVEETIPEEYRASFTSREDNKNAEGLNAASLKQVMDGLQCTDYGSLWFSPAATISSQEPVIKIPTYLEHCGLDPLRDDATIYKKLLELRGIPTRVTLLPEDVHNSWTVVDSPKVSKNPTMKEAQMAGMKWLLSFS